MRQKLDYCPGLALALSFTLRRNKGCTMLRITIYATLIVILTMGAASAQNDLQDIRAGENSWLTEKEKKNEMAIDRAYRSTIKTLSDTKKEKSDPWADVRSAPPAADKNKQ